MKVSSVWRGHGSAVFLELGALRKRHFRRPGEESTRLRKDKGEATVMVEWSWRIERARSIAVGSWSTERRINSGIKALLGARVVGISLEGRLPELVISFTGARWLQSFMTAEGQPQWAVKLPDFTWLRVRKGRLARERPD
jgi:hypothetical protein